MEYIRTYMKEKDRVIFHHSSKWHCEYLEKIISSYMAPHESKRILKKLLQCCLLMRPQIQGHPLWKTQQWPQERKRSVFIPIPKKGNARVFRLLHNCPRFTCQYGHPQNPPRQALTVHELRNSRDSSWIQKRQRNQKSNCQHLLDHRKSKRIPEIFYFIDYAKAFGCVDHNILWKILKEKTITDYLICILQNLYAGQEATVRTGHGTTELFQIRKGVCQGCILSCCLFKLYAEYIMRNAGLDEVQAGIKIAVRNINNLRCANDTTLMAES